MGKPYAFMLGNEPDDDRFPGTHQNGIASERFDVRFAVDFENAKKYAVQVQLKCGWYQKVPASSSFKR